MERGVVESLLGEACSTAERDALMRLVAAAAGPAHPGELAGEDAAVAAFQRPGPASLHRPTRRALLTRLLTVKVTAAFAATALGGVAVAAATGNLPEIPGTSGFGARPNAPTSPAPPTAGEWPGGPAVPAGPRSISPSSALVDLCRALVADVDGKPPKDREKAKQQALDSPDFASLVTAAGGKGKTMPYCVRLLQTSDAGDAAPSADNSPNATKTPHHSKSPRPHTTGKPSP